MICRYSVVILMLNWLGDVARANFVLGNHERFLFARLLMYFVANFVHAALLTVNAQFDI